MKIMPIYPQYLKPGKNIVKTVDQIIKSLSLNSNSLVLEVASNDGCLLENFKKEKSNYWH